MYFRNTPIDSMQDAYKVAGKNVVVTGGNRGIGRGVAEAFAQCGANVAIVCRNEESGKKACEELAKYGGKYRCFQADVSDRESAAKASKEIIEWFGTVDVLVNNAGVASTTPFFSEKGLDEWHRVIDTNLHGMANMVYCIGPNMRASGKGGAIINVSSVGSMRVSGSKESPKPSYNASKAGIDIFSRYLALVMGDDGIRVNSLVLGPVHTDLDKMHDPEYFVQMEEKLPTHRIANPIEVGAFCVYLASPAGCQLTGANIPFDGGLLCVI